MGTADEKGYVPVLSPEDLLYREQVIATYANINHSLSFLRSFPAPHCTCWNEEEDEVCL